MKLTLSSFAAILSLLFLSSFTQSQGNTVLPPGDDLLTCTLAAPATFDATIVSASSVSLTWSAVSGASAYYLSVYELGTGGYTLLTHSVESGLSKTQSGLDTSKSYRFTLASMCSANSVSDYIIGNDEHP